MFSVTAAEFVGNFCETLFYGIYLTTCYFCVPTLFMKGPKGEEKWRHPREIHWVMAVIYLALFVICTFDLIIGFAHNYNAFVQLRDPQEELSSSSSWINIARSINQILILIVGDFLLIYRCWIVYGRRWLVILPSTILFLGTVSVSCRLVAMYAELWMGTESLPINHLTIPWWTTLFVITAVQNVLSSGILIWRIWAVERQVERFSGRDTLSGRPPRYLRKVIRVIAESGAAYVTILITNAFLTGWQDLGSYVLADMALQGGGIVFNVIIARCSSQREQQFGSYNRSELSTIRFAHTTLGENDFSDS